MSQDLRVDYSKVQTLAFAGGGNRCWWQAGLMHRLREHGASLPQTLVGTSAGAAMAAACLTDGLEGALDKCKKLFAANERIFDWAALGRLKINFAHRHTYPAWIGSFVHAGNFQLLKNARSALWVAVTRPAWALGLTGSVAAGTLAYVIDKKVWHSVHPRLPRLIGLRQEFLSIQACETVQEARKTLTAAAAAPPFLPH